MFFYRLKSPTTKGFAMHLTTKSHYAVMAMLDMALLCHHDAKDQHNEDYCGGVVSLETIALRQGISSDYLRHLFVSLRRAGLVKSRRGPGGGYCLALPPKSIAISSIMHAVDEPLKVTRCTAPNRGCTGTTGRCIAHHLWKDLGQRITSYLREISLGDVVQGNAMKGKVAMPFSKVNNFS